VRTLSLRYRLTFLIAGMILPLIAASGIIIYQNYQAARRETADRVLQATRGTMAAVDRELQNVIAALRVLALSPALQSHDLDAFRREAERFTSQYPPGHIVTVSDRAGQQLLNTGVAPGAALPRRTDPAAVRSVFETRKPYVSDVFVGAIIRHPLFTVDVPVLSGGEVIYDVAFNPPRGDFLGIIDGQRLPSDWVISILDRDARHVARRPVLSGEGLSRAAPSLAAALERSSEAIADTVSLEGTPLLAAFTRSRETGWIVAIGLPSDTIAAPALRSLAITVTVGLVFLGVGLVFALRLAANLTRAEADRELLIQELNHRVKNTLSTVQSIVVRTLRGAQADSDAKKAIEARLIALSRAHNVLSERFWQDAGLRETVVSVLEVHRLAAPGRILARGPDIRLKPQSALAIATIVNELATNATKYGALAGADGRVSLLWEVTGGRRDGACSLRWTERDGSPIAPPARQGFGLMLIERSVKDQLNGTITMDFAAAGLTCVIAFPLHESVQAAASIAEAAQ
jgi:two-component sensor histidine kinase